VLVSFWKLPKSDNGKDLNRVWLSKEEIAQGGELTIEASSTPTQYGADNIWISSVD